MASADANASSFDDTGDYDTGSYFGYGFDCEEGSITLFEKPLSLEDMQRYIGGPLTMPPRDFTVFAETGLKFPNSVDVFCNEDGLLLDLPRNPWFKGDVRGPVLVVKEDHETGDLLPFHLPWKIYQKQ